MGKRSVGGLLSCAVVIVTLSGCATGTLTGPSVVTTGPATSTNAVTSTVAASSAAASAAEQARLAAASAAAQSSRASAAAQAARAAAQSAAESTALQTLSDDATSQPPADQGGPGAADTSSVADTSTVDASTVDASTVDASTVDISTSALSEADALAHGWYDEFGWISPDTAARALAAGIPLGANVPDNLRCGTQCGENPTDTEIQAQKSAEAASAAAAATQTSPTCSYVVVRGVCYATPSEAAAAGE